jgi:hypothetical protein
MYRKGDEMKRNIRAGRLLAIAGLTMAAAASQAVITLDFTDVCTGDPPGGTGPFATLTIADVGANTVRLTLSHNASSAAGQFLTRLELYVNPLPGDAAAGPLDPFVDAVEFGFGNDAGYTYNIAVEYDNAPPPDRLLPGLTSTQDISGTGLSEMSFATLPSSSDVWALLHMQGIGAGGEGSAKLCGTLVPEPSTILALVVGGLTLLRLRKRG